MESSNGDRIVVLIDMDCFFCQVETKLRPEYAGKPLAVVQYNQWRSGGIIAVNYEAREYGVTRHMRGDEAKEKCPDLILASVPCLRGKADTSRYRNAGREVIDVIRKHCNLVERASVDEAYLDLTDMVEKRLSAQSVTQKQLIEQLPMTFIVGYSEVGKNDEEERSRGMKTWISNTFEEFHDVQAQKLAIAGIIVEEIRADIFEKAGYRCSAGIAQNKILAKLACGLHKPNRQTILPAPAVPALYSTLPVKKVRNLGGKFGDVVVESLNCNVMGDLLQYSLQYLQKRFDDKTGLWLYNIARGVDNDPVTMRLVSKSIGACKKFPGKQAIVSLDVLKHWAGELAAEVCERLDQDLEENVRIATLLTISYHYYRNRSTVSQSRSCRLISYNPEKMAASCVDIVTKSTQCPVAFLGVSAGKFVPAKGRNNFVNFFTSTVLETNAKTNAQQQNQVECTSLSRTAGETVTSDLKIDRSICTLTNTNETSESQVNLGITSDSKIDKAISTLTETNEMAESHSENAKIDLETRKKAAGSSKTHLQLCETNSDVNADVSPTSRRVKNLIKSLKKRSNVKTCSKNNKNNCDTNGSLDQEKFKGSFFMNYFNKKEKCTYPKTKFVESHDKKEIDILCGGLDENNLEVSNNYFAEENSHINETKPSDVKKCDFNIEKNDDYEETLDSRMKNNCKRRSTSCRTKEKENMPNVIAIDNNKHIGVQYSSVQLQEIFPDLNNIDSSIVALLPFDLQKEAKLYMKPFPKSNVKSTENILKNSKSKNNKHKTMRSKGKKINNIDTFLIKESPCRFNDEPLQLCTQCNAMISIKKYNEHSDFHVAENLQRELNNPVLQCESAKRKIDSSDIDMNSVKRRSGPDELKLIENSKSVTMFLSQ